MDFKKWNQQAQDADSFLDTLGKTLWKRKWLLLFLGFCWVVYWAFTQPPIVEESAQEVIIDSTEYWRIEDSIYNAESNTVE